MLKRLAKLERPPGSPGEAAAAQLIAAELAARGARTRVESVSVHGTYWIPIGLACAAATVPGAVGARAGALLAALAARRSRKIWRSAVAPVAACCHNDVMGE